MSLVAEPHAFVEHDTIHWYLHTISQVDVLSASEERALAERVTRGDKEARTRFLEANLKLVVSIAKGMANGPEDLLDLIQEGNIGLMRALEKFDYTKGYKFSTYATWWIKQAIGRAIAEKRELIHLPVYLDTARRKLYRLLRTLPQELGREPTYAELALSADIAEEQVIFLLAGREHVVSLDIQYEDDEHTYGDFVEDTRSGIEDMLLDADLKRDIARALGRLTPQERMVMELRYGLVDGHEHSLKVLSKKLGVSVEWVRQIERKARQKLKPALQKALA